MTNEACLSQPRPSAIFTQGGRSGSSTYHSTLILTKNMTHKEIDALHDEICQSVYAKNLKIAFDKMTSLAESGQVGEWNDKRTELETTYKYMLQYVTEGINDPAQDQIYNHLCVSLLETSDHIKERVLLKDSSNYVYCQKRIVQSQQLPSEQEIMDELSSFNINQSLAGLLEDSLNSKGKATDYAAEHEKAVSKLYNHFWLTDKFKPQEEDLASHILTNEDIHFADKCLTISAVTTSLIRMFDERKFNILILGSRNEDPQVAQRALVGLILCAYIHNKRTPLYRQLDAQLTDIAQDPTLTKSIKEIMLQFIQSKETEKINKKLREDFFPDIAKISPIIQEKLQMDKLMKDEKTLLDKNPEWENLLNSGISDKIQQFAEMQQSGADVFLSSFSSMKSFPFFHETCNWFMPFHNHSALAKIQGDEGLPLFWKVIMQSPFLCNSDKFSLALGLVEMPEDYRKMTYQSVSLDEEQMKLLKENEKALIPEPEANAISNQYIQDIYRFFKLHPRKNDFADPFKSLDLYKLNFIKKMENEDEFLRSLGEAYFSKDYFEDSVEIFKKLVAKDESNAELLQKTGYCHQRLGDFATAIDYYQKADVIKPDSLWTIRKLAYCYRSIKETAKALDYYLQAQAQAPEDMAIQLAIGNCHLELKQYDKALQVFFKIEFLSPGNKNVWRPIAWCSFVEGKLDQAKKYYKKLDEAERNHHDWLNLGHVVLCKGDRKQAIAYYIQCLKKLNSDSKNFNALFNEDLPFLEQNGFDGKTAPFLQDKILYEAEGL